MSPFFYWTRIVLLVLLIELLLASLYFLVRCSFLISLLFLCMFCATCKSVTVFPVSILFSFWVDELSFKSLFWYPLYKRNEVLVFFWMKTINLQTISIIYCLLCIMTKSLASIFWILSILAWLVILYLGVRSIAIALIVLWIFAMSYFDVVRDALWLGESKTVGLMISSMLVLSLVWLYISWDRILDNQVNNNIALKDVQPTVVDNQPVAIDVWNGCSSDQCESNWSCYPKPDNSKCSSSEWVVRECIDWYESINWRCVKESLCSSNECELNWTCYSKPSNAKCSDDWINAWKCYSWYSESNWQCIKELKWSQLLNNSKFEFTFIWDSSWLFLLEDEIIDRPVDLVIIWESEPTRYSEWCLFAKKDILEILEHIKSKTEYKDYIKSVSITSLYQAKIKMSWSTIYNEDFWEYWPSWLFDKYWGELFGVCED